MPPALTDDEESDRGELNVPAPKNGKAPAAAAAEADEDEAMGGEGDEEDEEDLEPDEFVVESILGHKLDLKTGELRFHVKWEGYDDPQDRTWEPEDNLADSANEILQEYYLTNGGRDAVMNETSKAIKNKKRSRPSAGAANPAANKRSKRAEADDALPAPAGSRGFKTPAGSWEERISTLDAAIDNETGKIAFFATWEDGTKTKHDKETIYKRCPMKAIRFFERHLKTPIVVDATPDDEDAL